MDAGNNPNTTLHGTEVANDPGKMFIGGLSWQTETDSLRDYFRKYGDIKECVIMRDPTSKKSRGFGFVTFGDPKCVEKVLKTERHEVDSKKIDPKVAFPKRSPPKPVTRTKKIFIGGLAAQTTPEDLKNYFQQFGKVEDVTLMMDRQTNRHRGFGFVVMENEDNVDKICDMHYHEVKDKMVEAKKAQPKEVMMPQNQLRQRTALMRNMYGMYVAPWNPYAQGTCTNPSYPANFAFGRSYPAYPPFTPYFSGFSGAMPAFTPGHQRGSAVRGRSPGRGGYANYHGAPVMNSPYAQQSYAPSPSPVNNRSGFNVNSSPGPMDLYAVSTTQAEQNAMSTGFVPAVSPQPNNYGMGQTYGGASQNYNPLVHGRNF
ncbi:RNA-binding protein Musashi homolog Rbp6-like isoform X5 [Asterias amurensis]|uniref:RNA-binding protein Musashi homolog Rbp6-like isoform X5 n=1 Tax=Asterias amurensis TaxID=7602 RepID=UPI003AB89D19